MISHVLDKNGNWRRLSLEEEIRINEKRLGLHPIKQKMMRLRREGKLDLEIINPDGTVSTKETS